MNFFLQQQKIKTSLSLLLLALSTTAYSANLYQVTDLGVLSNDTNSNYFADAYAINDSNQIVGNSSGIDFGLHAFSSQNAQMTDLGNIQGDFSTTGTSYAFDINDNNMAVGLSIETWLNDNPDTAAIEISNINHAVYYDIDNATVNRIPMIVSTAPNSASASAINNNNLVVGYGFIDPDGDVDSENNELHNLYERGFFYDISNSTLTSIEPINAVITQRIVLRDVNDGGYAVGIATENIDNIITQQVVGVNVNNPTVLEKITLFGGFVQHPWAVNSSKKIVGKALTDNTTSAVFEAFIYDGQTSIGLGFLNNDFKYSEAYDINESDQVVGMSKYEPSKNVYHAFLYENGTMKDLNKLISCEDAAQWRLSEARGINDDAGGLGGVIVGSGLVGNERHAFMLTPLAGNAPNCPQVVAAGNGSSGSTSLVYLSGLSLLAFFRKRKLK